MQMQLIAPLFGQRHADQAATVNRHKVNYFSCYLLRGADKIAFVLPILVVNDDDHFAVANILDGVLNA